MARIRIDIDLARCDGCGVCVPACAQTALRLEEGKARVVAGGTSCHGLERCLGVCPRGALRVVRLAPDEG